MKRISIFGVILGIVVVTGATTQFSLQQALNLLAGNTRAPYTALSTQQAANILVAKMPAEAYDMKPTVTFVWDDVARELWGEDSLLVEAAGDSLMRIRDILHHFNIDGGIAMEPQNVLYGDTVTTSLSISMIRALQRRGWDVGTVGWDEISGMYDGDASLLAQGYSVAQADTFYNNMLRAVQCQRDTLGLGQPRWISHSNASGTYVTDLAAARTGIEFGFQSGLTATNNSTQGQRPNRLAAYHSGRWGAWGTGGAGGRSVSASANLRPHRYEILQSIGEQSDSATCYQTIKRAMQTKGLVVFIGHKPSSWETTLEGQNGFYKFMQYLATLRDAGRIQILTPGEAADLYINQPLSPLLNHISPNLVDLDGDTHWDNTLGDNGAMAASDTAKFNLVAPAITHGGKRSFKLSWAGATSTNTFWAGTADSAWATVNGAFAVIPPAGGGWTARFEAWIICDTTVASAKRPGKASGGGATKRTAGNTWVGAVFYGPIERFARKYDTSADLLFLYDQNTQFSALMSVRTQSTSTPFNSTPSNTANFFYPSRVNTLYAPDAEWGHLVAEWDVPDVSDYLIVSLQKHDDFPADEIIVSDVSLTFYRRGMIPATTKELLRH